MSNHSRNSKHFLLAVAILTLGACDISKENGTTRNNLESKPSLQAKEEGRSLRMLRSEERVRELTPKLRTIATWLTSGERSSPPPEIGQNLTLPADWEQVNGDRVWQQGSFGVLSANLNDSTMTMVTKFEAVGQSDSGEVAGLRAKQRLTWKLDNTNQWRVSNWEQLGFNAQHSPQPLFKEVLDTALPDDDARKKARRSYQEELTETAYSKLKLMVEKLEYGQVPDTESTSLYPAVSVVDYDSDGFDDLFVSSRLAPPQLLRNKGDGTFVDATRESGLTIRNFVNCALFADFDNDGDPDVLVGRTLEPSLYFRNDDGHFRDMTDKLTDLGDQYFITAITATDVNRDGLLDVYLSTYGASKDAHPIWKQRYLTAEHKSKLDAISNGVHPFFDQRGMANVLLMNRGGGRLKRAGGEAVELWRRSYQPCWFDADGDGDDDLYVCNDFAPDSFLRNDTPRGSADPVFTDAFAETFPNGTMAFGMGVSAGDYDNDGDLDLFVSNMYSKAGNRIIQAIGEVDPRIEVAARGNFLYRNDGNTFHQVAAADAPETKVGWAFGGQFADFNNDGRLDLYVPSGLYTAPKSIATDVDL